MKSQRQVSAWNKTDTLQRASWIYPSFQERKINVVKLSSKGNQQCHNQALTSIRIVCIRARSISWSVVLGSYPQSLVDIARLGPVTKWSWVVVKITSGEVSWNTVHESKEEELVCSKCALDVNSTNDMQLPVSGSHVLRPPVGLCLILPRKTTQWSTCGISDSKIV